MGLLEIDGVRNARERSAALQHSQGTVQYYYIGVSQFGASLRSDRDKRIPSGCDWAVPNTRTPSAQNFRVARQRVNRCPLAPRPCPRHHPIASLTLVFSTLKSQPPPTHPLKGETKKGKTQALHSFALPMEHPAAAPLLHPRSCLSRLRTQRSQRKEGAQGALGTALATSMRCTGW
jgi:hypothetical protein